MANRAQTPWNKKILFPQNMKVSSKKYLPFNRVFIKKGIFIKMLKHLNADQIGVNLIKIIMRVVKFYAKLYFHSF